MKYQPGGYSWLGVAPESDEEMKIEDMEERLYHLKKEYKKSEDEKLLKEMVELEKKIQSKQP